MDIKLLKVLAIAALTIGMATACDDDGDGGSNGGNNGDSCSANASKCESGAMYTCTDGSWKKASDCASGKCSDATKCEEASSAVCSAGESKCENGKLYACTGSGWGSSVNCPTGECADAEKCKETSQPEGCTNGSVMCSNGVQYSCKNNSWDKLNTCDKGCAADGQNCAVDTCTGTETKCNGKYVMTCTNGSFVQAAEPCANGCYQGACKKGDSEDGDKKVGDPCDIKDKGHSYCSGDQLLYCDGSKIVLGADCSSLSGQVPVYCDSAKAFSGKGIAECVMECGLEYNNQIVDIGSDCLDNSFAVYACTEGESGKYGVFTVSYSSTLCAGDKHAYTCSSAEGDVVEETCSNCTSDASALEGVCASPQVIAGKSSAKLGDACTDKGDLACDGNTPVACDGTKYVGLMQSLSNKEAVSCADAHGPGFFCDEKTFSSNGNTVRVADCVSLCDASEENKILDVAEKCKGGKFGVNLCLKSDADNYVVWGTTIDIMTADTVCTGETSALVCSSAEGAVTQKKCTSCTANASGAVCQ